MLQSQRVAVDIGGTFTDLVLFDRETGSYRTAKESTTTGELHVGVVQGLSQLVRHLDRMEFLIHGTTVGLNALLERKGARVALVTTEGFRDVYEIARGNRPDLYNMRYRKPRPLVPRRDIFEIPERIRFDGAVLQPLTREDLDPVIESLRRGKYEAVAVCLLHAYVNPVHEELVREVLSEALPHVLVSCSYQVAREWREYERTSTTVLNAYIAPSIHNYLTVLENEMRTRGFEKPLHIMRSNGGIMTADIAREQSIQTLLSGPVGGAVGVSVIGRLLDHPHLIGVDMGGTSFDVTMVVDKKPDVTTEAVMEGFPVLTPLIQIHTIGAGGGSLAWLEAGGLRVGPQSAGARPGPACYGRGGTQPTVTDANAALGRMDQQVALGGHMTLDIEAARQAIDNVGSELRLDIESAAEGILAVVNNKMADVIRTLTVGKGIDPRDFTLVAFGGAGPMHAAFIADLLDISTVIVPNFPGAFSAWGMLQTDVRHDVSRTFLCPSAEINLETVYATYREMEEEVLRVLERQNVAPEDRALVRTVDMRYVGQEYHLNIPWPTSDDGTPEDLLVEQLTRAFHETHHRVYGHCSSTAPTELAHLRVTGIGRVAQDLPEEPVPPTMQPVPAAERAQTAYFDGHAVSVPCYSRASLLPGHEVVGPALVTELTATTVVPPGWRLAVDGYGHLVLSKEEGN